MSDYIVIYINQCVYLANILFRLFERLKNLIIFYSTMTEIKVYILCMHIFLFMYLMNDNCAMIILPSNCFPMIGTDNCAKWNIRTLYFFEQF